VVDPQRAVPGQGLVRSDRVVYEPVVSGVLDQIQAVNDLAQVASLLFQRLEAVLPRAVLARRYDPDSSV